jgi:hypothetical protein
MRKWLILTGLLILTACSKTQPPNLPINEPLKRKTAVFTPHPSQINRRTAVPEPVTFGLTMPKDAIRPIYQPKFVPAADAPYHDEELVMGVNLNGQAKAYSVSVLRFREMVNDELGGTPILVTW